jgi:hypothetical protein
MMVLQTIEDTKIEAQNFSLPLFDHWAISQNSSSCKNQFSIPLNNVAALPPAF